MADDEKAVSSGGEPEVPEGFVKVSATEYPALYNTIISNSVEDYLRSIGVDPESITDDNDTTSEVSIA